MPDGSMTVTEAAKKLGVSPRTVQRYCRQGRLKHAWVQGKRHQELRILPPIEMSLLPGGKRRRTGGTFDAVSRIEFDETVADLQRRLDARDRQIAVLEEELAEIKSLTAAGGTDISPARIRAVIRDAELVRPAEKKLLLKLANEVRSHAVYLKILGMTDSVPAGEGPG